MGLELRDDTAVLSGVVTVDEAEGLVTWLRSGPGGRVDVRDCTHLHTAVLQALVFFRPAITGPFADPFLQRHVMTILHAVESTGAHP